MGCESRPERTSRVAVAIKPVEKPMVRVIKFDMADVAGRGVSDKVGGQRWEIGQNKCQKVSTFAAIMNA